MPQIVVKIAAARQRYSELMVIGIQAEAAIAGDIASIANSLVVDFETLGFELDRLDNLVEDH